MKKLVSVIFSFVVLFVPFLAFAKDETAGGSYENLDQGFTITSFGVGLLTVAVVIGALYSLWKTTQAYGGIIGQGIRLIGAGSIFLAVEALDRMTSSFGVGVIDGLVSSYYEPLVHDVLLIIALLFTLFGFTKLLSATRVSQ